MDTPIGRIRQLTVEGAWSAAYTELFRERQCDAVSWRPPRTRGGDLGPLRALAASLRHVSVAAGAPMDDSALRDLHVVESLDALTSAHNALDLGGLEHLVHVALDDREQLSGFDRPGVRTICLYRTRRQLRDFQQATDLQGLVLEGSRRHVVDVAATLPELRRLRVVGLRVESLAGLTAPALEHLELDSTSGVADLDLSPLRDLPRLTRLHVRGPSSVKNAAALADLSGLTFSWSSRVHVPDAELVQLPEAWRRAHDL